MSKLRFLSLLGPMLVLTTPAFAQMQGMPVYFSPKGGTGITLNGDFGRVASTDRAGFTDSNHPTAMGGRLYLGLPIVTLGVGASVFDTKVINQTNSTQYMGSAAFKLFGGPLVPVAVSLQGAASYLKSGSGTGATKTVTMPIGVGIGINVPTPGASLEPWAAGRVQLNSVSTGSGITNVSQTRLGYGVSGGINFGLPIGLGLHLAVDWSTFPAKISSPIAGQQAKLTQLVVGVGLHYMIKMPGLPGVPLI